MTQRKLIIGIDGGGTKTQAILFDDTGKIKGNLSSIRKSIIDMEELKRVNDETNILEFIDNFTRINDRKPRLHELKEQFDGQISVEFLKNMMEEIYNKRVDDIEINVDDI